MRVPLGVGLVTAALYFGRLGQVLLVDASEGFHVAIAWEMAARGDWITPHFDGVRYFDKPPLLSERLGLIAGLMVAANMEVFLFVRLAKPDLLFVFFILLAFAGFIVAYQSASRRALLVCYASLGAAVMAKDLLGALGPLAVFALFFVLTRERFKASS